MSPLSKKVGIIGGGQLGKMLIESSLPLNIHCNILENATDCPASHVAYEQIIGELTNGKSIEELAEISDVLTYEIEHVDTQTLKKLEEEGKEIIPSPRILEMIQDKGLQKQFYADNNIPTSRFKLVDSPAQWIQAIETLGFSRFVAKSRTGGYDGKGVAILDINSIKADPNTIPFDGPSVIEDFIDCDKELSVIVARDRMGNVKTFPTVEMSFDPEANLVDYLFAPAEISSGIDREAKAIAIDAINKMGGVGLFAVELFLEKDGTILVNEIAPRPHNSGHHTIEACITSQYEQLLRILVGLPLGETTLLRPAAMINVLGTEGVSGEYQLAGLDEVLGTEGVYLHLYNKKETRPKRKMGHITILADTLEELKTKVTQLKDKVIFEPLNK